MFQLENHRANKKYINLFYFYFSEVPEKQGDSNNITIGILAFLVVLLAIIVIILTVLLLGSRRKTCVHHNHHPTTTKMADIIRSEVKMRPKSTNVDLQGSSPLPPEALKLLNWPKANNEDKDDLKKDTSLVESDMKLFKTEDKVSPQSESTLLIEEQMVKLLLDIPGITDPNNFRKSV